jgi:hypothetical protein
MLDYSARQVSVSECQETLITMKSLAMTSSVVLCAILTLPIGTTNRPVAAASTDPKPPTRPAVVPAPAAPSKGPAARPRAQVLFDDFSYSSHEDLVENGWVVRSAAGWPGVPGAVWWKDGVSFLDDPQQQGNRLMRMTSSTDGTGARTNQTQVCHQRKYLEGTYAARVRFTDSPVSGTAGDQVVETFYMISPLAAPMDLAYSEMDFEYLPFGGWGSTGRTLFTTTWETFSPEPNWKQDNVSKNAAGSREGWRTLVIQVADEQVRYFVDGELFAEHGGRFYPESLMSINFNLWFIKDGLAPAGDVREYREDIDWVFFQAGTPLKPAEVDATVASLRRRSVKFRDTVPAPVPALVSPCDF